MTTKVEQAAEQAKAAAEAARAAAEQADSAAAAALSALEQAGDAVGAAVQGATGGAVDPFVFRLAVFVLAIFVGYYVVWSVTPALHTPLMSVTNARMRDSTIDILEYISYSFTFIYNLEFILKLIAYKWKYFKLNQWNNFNFVCL